MKRTDIDKYRRKLRFWPRGDIDTRLLNKDIFYYEYEIDYIHIQLSYVISHS